MLHVVATVSVGANSGKVNYFQCFAAIDLQAIADEWLVQCICICVGVCVFNTYALAHLLYKIIKMFRNSFLRKV